MLSSVARRCGLWLALAAGLLPACSSGGANEGNPLGDRDAALAGDGAPDASRPRPEACFAIDKQLDAAVERVLGDRPFDAMLAWSNPDCGTAFFTHGPSNLTERHLFRVASLTKTYVAVLTLTMVERGELSLDERVDERFPDAPESMRAITVRQLLQHTSGLFNYSDAEAFFQAIDERPNRVWTPEELVEIGLSEPMYSAPGDEWHYSNTGYIVLGMILEKAGNAPLATLLRDRILAPNGLDETFLDGAESVEGTIAPGFDSEGRNASTRYHPSMGWTAGGLVASLPDAARFYDRLGQGRLLSAESQAEMLKGVPSQNGLLYGLGIYIDEEGAMVGGAAPAIGHDGDAFFYFTRVWYFPDTKTTLVALMNQEQTNPNEVMDAAMEVLFTTKE